MRVAFLCASSLIALAFSSSPVVAVAACADPLDILTVCAGYDAASSEAEANACLGTWNGTSCARTGGNIVVVWPACAATAGSNATVACTVEACVKLGEATCTLGGNIVVVWP